MEKTIIENKYNCSKPIWRKFSNEQKLLWNMIMDCTLYSQKLIAHPQSPVLQHSHWETICYNIACEAAWALERIEE